MLKNTVFTANMKKQMQENLLKKFSKQLASNSSI